jgi:Rieske Fe-S protein
VVAAAGAVGLTAALSACGDAGGGTAASGTVLGKTTEIPEGGGKVFKDQRVVVTQPTAGEFKAFSAICTHQGCTVADVSGGTINCACHNSTFDITDGSVKGGPAPTALPGTRITVQGGSITVA